MIYLKRVYISADEMRELEKAMRKVSLKRTRSLSFESATTDIGTDKLFLGFAGKRDVTFARLRTSFEKFFPKIIISFPRDETDSEYKFRYSTLSMTVIVLYLLFLLLVTFSALANNTSSSNILIPVILVGGFISLTLLELKIVNYKIKKAVNLYKSGLLEKG